MSFSMTAGLSVLLCVLSAVFVVVSRRVASRETPPTHWIRTALDLLPVVVLVGAFGIWTMAFSVLSGAPTGVGGFLGLSTGCLAAIVVTPFIGRARAVATGLLVVVVSGLLVADIVYWRFFDSLMPVAAGDSIGLVGDVSESVFSLLQAGDALAFVVLLTGAILFLWPKRSAPRRRHVAESGALAVVLLLAGIPAIQDVNGWLGTRFSWKVFGWDQPLQQVGVVQAHLRDFARTYREVSLTEDVTDAQVDAYAAHNAQSRPIDDTTLASYGVAKGKNVLFLQVEALQQWTIGATADGKEITPFLNAAREEGVFFSKIWDVTGNSPTADCEYAALNSQYPLAQGSVAFRRPGNDFMSLPKVLAAAGYKTFSGHAARPRMWNRGVIHPAWGFEKSWWRDSYPTKPRFGWGLADHTFLKKSVEKLSKVEGPWFGFLLTLSTHHPYTYLPRREDRLKVKIGGRVGEYAGSIRYIDDAIRQTFFALDRAKLLDDTVVVVYGDHDSKLKFSSKVKKVAAKKLSVDADTLESLRRRGWRTKRIPLFVLLPEQSRRLLTRLRTGPVVAPPVAPSVAPPAAAEPGAEGNADAGVADADAGAVDVVDEAAAREAFLSADIDVVGSQVDFAPTVLHYMGIPTPKSWVGKPLVAGAKGFAARYNGSGVDDKLVWISKHRKCQTHAGKNHPLEKCAPLRKRIEQDLERSWRITLNDLSTRIESAGDTSMSK